MSPIKPSSAVPTYPALNAPRSLHFPSIFVFALQTVLFVSLSWVKTTHTSQATLQSPVPPNFSNPACFFFQKHVLRNVRTHTNTQKNRRTLGAKGHLVCAMKRSMKRKATAKRKQICQQYVALCVKSQSIGHRSYHMSTHS